MRRPIAISISPNTQSDDVWVACKTLLMPWVWQEGSAKIRVQTWLSDYFSSESVSLFASGRAAMMHVLKALGVGSGDEVIVQAFTCVAVPDSVLWTGAKPIYTDIDDSLNIDPNKLEKLITKKTKAIIVQHTFGIPADLDKILSIAKKHKLFLIEDCAHALGATYKGKKVGTFGDAAICSFGRDKIVSSVFGGAAILKNGMKLGEDTLRSPSYFWIFQQLIHPVIFAIALPLYWIKIGKGIVALARKIGILSLPIEQSEKKGGKPTFLTYSYPNALAILLENQLKKLEVYNRKRISIAQKYASAFPLSSTDGAIYLRCNIRTLQARDVLSEAKRRDVLLGTWYRDVIDPTGVDFDTIGYKRGSCPHAEKIAAESVNLPTYPSMTDEDVTTVISLCRHKK